jgi:glycosyltransferase involved in cell wall biosynthesis
MATEKTTEYNPAPRRMISIVVPCYNEEGNVENMHRAIADVFLELPQYDYEHIFIDNASTDGTRAILRRMATEDSRVKLIFNTRNFGPSRSHYYGVLQAKGDAVIPMAADFQEPPALIPELIKQWEDGHKTVQAVKSKSKESPVMFAIRKLYYSIVTAISDVPLVKNNTGFGLYDRRVIESLRAMDEAAPYFRGLVSEVGFESISVEYEQPRRASGKTHYSVPMLFDTALSGMVSHSRAPLRLATLIGFCCSAVSLLAGIVYFIYKMANWNSFSTGMAPLVIGMFFIGSVQLFFLGLVGEYVGAIYTQVLNRPLVVEAERVNF